MNLLKIFQKTAPKAKTNKAILTDVLPGYSSLFEETRLTPSAVKVAIETWRTDGEIQDLSNLFDLFMDSDDNLLSCVRTRKATLKRAIYSFTASMPQQKKDYFTTLLDANLSSWIDTFMESKLCGFHFNQIMYDYRDGMYWPAELLEYSNLDLRKKNRKLELYEKGRVVELAPYKFISILYRRPTLHTLLKYYIFYSYALNNWAQFTETYGKPIRVGKYDSQITAEELSTLKAAIKALGTDQGVVISKETEIEFIDYASKDKSQNLYETLCKFVTDRITRAILGQTLSTQEGDTGSYAQAKVHNEVRKDIAEEDIADLRRFLNVICGYADAVNFGGSGIELWLASVSPVDLEKRIVIDEKLRAMGLPISQDHFYDTYEVDRPEKGQELMPERTAAPAVPNSSQITTRLITNSDTPAGVAKSLAKMQKEIRALKSLKALQEYRPRWFISEFGARLASDAVKSYVVGRKAKKANSYSLPDIEFEWDDGSIAAANSLRNQSYIIAGVRTSAQIQELAAEAAGAIEGGMSFSDFMSEAVLKGFEPTNPYHLKTEFETAKRASESMGRWAEIEADKDIFPYLKYVTMQDDLVRDEHRVLDGIVAPVDDSFWSENYPPNGYNCRCETEQLTAAEGESDPGLEIPRGDANLDPTFKTNPGRTLKLPSNAPDFYGQYADEASTSLNRSSAPITNSDLPAGALKDVSGYPVKLRDDEADKTVKALQKPSEIWHQNGRISYVARDKDAVRVIITERGRVIEATEYSGETYRNEGRTGFNEYGL